MENAVPFRAANVTESSDRHVEPEPAKQDVLSEELEIVPADSGHPFNITVVYQDALTRSWARQICGPVAQKFGADSVQHSWHDVGSLNDPAKLIEAVRTTLAADVIVVSVHAAEELPMALYVWITVWLPRRRARNGTLAALIGMAGASGSHAVRTQKYLQAVARRGQLEFTPHERNFSPADVSALAPSGPGGNGVPHYFKLTTDGQTEFRF